MKNKFPVHPRVIVSLKNGIATVYSNDPDLDVEIVDMDVQDEEDFDRADKRQNEVRVMVAAKKLFEVA